MTLRSRLGVAAAALLLAGAGGAALAHPHAEDEGDGGHVERVIVVRDGKGGDHPAGADRVRRLEHGIGDLAKCEGGEKIVDEQGEHEGKKTKIFICQKGEFAAGDARHLENALARIRDEDHFSDEQKARIETALRSAIDRARSAR